MFGVTDGNIERTHTFSAGIGPVFEIDLEIRSTNAVADRYVVCVIAP